MVHNFRVVLLHVMFHDSSDNFVLMFLQAAWRNAEEMARAH